MAHSEPATAPIGHNNPPISEILTDQFKGELASVESLAERANKMPKEISSDDELPKLAAIVKDCRALSKTLDKLRLAETEPLRERTSATNNFFNTSIKRLDRMNTAANATITKYNQKKIEDERQRRLAEEEEARKEAAAKLQAATEASGGSETEIAMAEAQAAEDNAAKAKAETRAKASDIARTTTEAGTVSSRSVWTFAIENSGEIPLDQLRPYFGIDAIEKALRGYVNANKSHAKLPGVRFFQQQKAIVR